MNNKFVVGRSKKIITPPLGTPLYGYPKYEERKATAVHDELYANVGAFGYDEPTALLISLDICALRTDMTDRIANEIAKSIPINEKSIIICETHTHSGPCCTFTPGWGVSNDSYIEDILIPSIISAAKEAYENAEEALLGIGTTESRVAINRREWRLDGMAHLGQNPYGCFDPEMSVLSFVNKSKEPILNIIHYGCHGTACGAETEISRDFAGVMVDRLEAESGALTFFANGAEGDVGPRLSNGKTTGTMELAMEIGKIAAEDAVRAFNTISEYNAVDFEAINGDLVLPYKPFPTKSELKNELCELEKGEIIGTSIILQNTLKARLKVYEDGETIPDSMKISQCLLRFNSAVFVPFPFEVFSEVTVRLREFSPFRHTLCLCNANGALGYLPSQEQIIRGGYEIDQFNRRHTFCLVDNTDDIMVEKNLELIKKLHK